MNKLPKEDVAKILEIRKNDPCQIWNFDSISFQDIFDKAVLLAKESKEEAITFFNEYAEWILKAANDVATIDEAIHRAKHNLGYHAGRYGKEIMDLIYSTYECEHPYLGKHPYELSAEQVMQIGYNIGKGLNN